MTDMINMMDMKMIESALGFQLVGTVLAFVFLLIIIVVITNAFSPRKSQDYRKLLTDMYVAGKIKKLAKKEDIDLVNEEKNYNLWCKKKRLENSDLDNAIEAEMKEKIATEEEEKTKK